MTGRTGIPHEPHPDDPIRCAVCGAATIPVDDCRGAWVDYVPIDGQPARRIFVPFRTAPTGREDRPCRPST